MLNVYFFLEKHGSVVNFHNTLIFKILFLLHINHADHTPSLFHVWEISLFAGISQILFAHIPGLRCLLTASLFPIFNKSFIQQSLACISLCYLPLNNLYFVMDNYMIINILKKKNKQEAHDHIAHLRHSSKLFCILLQNFK